MVRVLHGTHGEPNWKIMKRTQAFLFPALILAAVIIPHTSHAQSGGPGYPQWGGYAVTQRGANYAVHQKTTLENGTNHVHKYIELATGLNYTNSQGKLVESREQIDVLPNGGAVANHGRHTVSFPGDIYAGKIEVVTPDGLHLKSRPLAVGYDDGTNTVLIGVLTNSTGVLAASNQVIYPNAFAGLNADVRYTYRKSGFEQDIVLQEQPPVPETFGLSSKYARLEVLTEFFNPPEPKQTRANARARAGSPVATPDTTLTFGKMKMMQGKAFSIGSSGGNSAQTNRSRLTSAATRKVSVSKSWVHVQGRTFLIEELPLPSIAAQLQQLPAPASATVSSASARHSSLATGHLVLPPERPIEDSPVQLARADLKYKSGVVLDYDEVDSDYTTFTFASGSTYLISGPVYMGNDDVGDVIFEGGTVIKYTSDASTGITLPDYWDGDYETGPYNPVIFTSKDDDSVGEIIDGSTGSPATLHGVTFLGSPIEWGGSIPNYLYFRYAGTGMVSSDPNGIENCQFINCDQGIYHIEGELDMQNVLFANCDVAVYSGGYFGDEDFLILNAENVTADNGTAFETDGGFDSYQFTFHNSLFTRFANDTLALTVNGANDESFEQSDASCYQSAGGAGYYLANNSIYRNAGTTGGIFSGFSTENLTNKTTYPPAGLSGDFAASTMLYPCVPRDTALAPDVGYHYDPIDYLGDSLSVESGATLTLTNGVVIGVAGNNVTLSGNLVSDQTLANAQVQEAQSAPLGVYIGGNEDAADTDADGNGLPDWWEDMYFGTNGQNPSASDDGQGNTLLYDYLNGIYPNVIKFTIETTNYYVNHTNVSVQLNITAGTPSYYAVFVGSSTTTNWLAFTTTNLTVNLGTTDGVYTLNVGLKGFATNATQAWDDYSFTVDRVAPVVTITNPILAGAAGTVMKPWLQLQGFASEPLSSLSYDISNATGIATNLDVLVTDQAFNTNTIDYTTNYFQAYDVALATNVNKITLRMTDRSGNTTTTNFNVTLDYTGATNPAVKLTWPTNGMQICQGSFTLRGWTDDSAATVAATITDTNGDTNTITGEVERSGVLWVDNLPLAEGTNWVTLWVTNSAGLSSETNMAVVKNDMTLALTSIDGDLWQATVNVGGNIDPGYSVWVNGVQGTNYGDGTWGATNVPVSAGGVASFDMSASSGGGDPDSNTNMDKPAEIVTVQYGDGKSAIGHEPSGNVVKDLRTKNYNNNYTIDANGQYASQGWVETVEDYHGDTFNGGGWSDYVMSSANPGVYYVDWMPDTGGDFPDWGYIGQDEDSSYWITGLPDQDLEAVGGGDVTDNAPGRLIYHYYANNVHWSWTNPDNHEDLTVGARTRQKLLTGGRGKSGLMNLFCLSANGTVKNGEPGETSQWQGTQELGVDYTTILVNGMNLGADGNLWVPEPDNAAPDLVVTIPDVRHFNAWPGAQKYHCWFTAYADMPHPGGGRDDIFTFLSSSHAGHAWWWLWSDAPTDGLYKAGLNGSEVAFIGAQVGFFAKYPLTSIGFAVPGEFHNPGNGEKIDAFRQYRIGFYDLKKGLDFTVDLSNNPGYYILYPAFNSAVNCVTKTVQAGAAAGLAYPHDVTPQNFGIDLNLMPPSDIPSP